MSQITARQTSLNLSHSDKQAIERFMVKASSDQKNGSVITLESLAMNDSPAWMRYADGIYNHPKTWWIGIIQVQMVMGIWGHQRRAQAMIRQNHLARILHAMLDEKNKKVTEELVVKSLKFNLKYRKADMAGRLHGGLFTNYASMGGRKGQSLPRGLKWSGRITNFTLASFGATIQSIVKGNPYSDAILNSIISGKPERLPIEGLNNNLNTQESNNIQAMQPVVIGELYSVDAINQVVPKAVPLQEFCARPENINLKGLCQ